MEGTLEILEDMWQGLLTPIYYIIDPSKRINFVYLLSSLCLAYYVFRKTKSGLSFTRYIFNKKVWLSKSAFIDYKFIFFNGIVKILLIVPIIESWRYLGINVNDYLEMNFGLSGHDLSQTQSLLLYSISVVILYDLVFYIVHLAMHKIPFLWEFHKIHHSATSLNPITQYRLHPVELILNNLSYAIVSGVMMGVIDYFSYEQLNLSQYFSANVFSMVFLFWGANLRHSHVKLKYFTFLERFFISPYQHQIHHSDNPKHFDKNIGAKFAIWDWIFGTLIRSDKPEKITFGLGKKENGDYNTFLKNLYMPFIKLFTKK